MRTIAIVTGITSPLGQGLAKRLIEDRFHVIGVTRREDATPASLGVHDRVVCDLTDADSLQVAREQLARSCVGIDRVWVLHAAGMPVVRALEELAPEQFEQAMWANFMGPVALTYGLLPTIRATAGRVLWLGSISGRLCAPLLGSYGPPKAALKSYSSILDLELAHFGARSIYVELGNVQTGLHSEAATIGEDFPKASSYAQLYRQVPALAAELQSKAMPLDTAVDQIYAALTAATPKSVMLVGRDARMRAALSRIAPSLFGRIMRRKLGWLPR